MTTKDVTRFLFRPRKHYVGVRLQQGRLLLDSDFNESARLRAEDRRHSVLALVGGRASPNQGFSIGAPLDSPSSDQSTYLQVGSSLPLTSVTLGETSTLLRPVSVRAGSFYIGGQRVDLEKPEHIAFQRDFLQALPKDLAEVDPDVEGTDSPQTNFRNFYYLHAWEQGVTAVEDEELYEAALGGEDTSTRTRRMRRVEVLQNLPGYVNSCRRAWRRLLAQLLLDNATFDSRTGEVLSRGRLQLVFREESERQRCGQCNPDPGAAFLGFDNQSIKILLTSHSTFVWALSGGAPLYRVRVTGLDQPEVAGVRVEMMTPPADEAHWPLTNRVIEILPFGALLDGGPAPTDHPEHFRKIAAEVGAFTRVADSYDPSTRSFTIDQTVGLGALRDLVYQWDASHPAAAELNHSTPGERYFYMRVWHEAPNVADVELPIRLNERLPELGETDVFPIFRHFGRRGDYWIAAIRPGAPEPIVPFDLTHKAQGIPPHGPRHFYAPLALVEGGEVQSPGQDIVTLHADCRQQIQKLSDRGCVTFTVGDGIASFGDYASIQEAIDALPEDGGRISVRPGLYRERLFINGRHGIVIEGCGDATVIETPLDPGLPSAEPLIQIGADSENIVLTGLALRTVERRAIFVRQGAARITLSRLSIIAGVRQRGRFVPGTANSSQALIELLESHHITLSKVILEPVSRPGLLATRVDFLDVSELSAVGRSRSRFSPRRPMIALRDVDRATIRDTMVSAFGQVGLSLDGYVGGDSCADVTLRGLSVITGQHRSTRNGAITSSKSGVRIDYGERVTLEDSSIVMEASFSEHAAVVVFGTDLTLRGNRIEALTRCYDRPLPFSPERCGDFRALAWSGLQIRGGSERVDVRANHIVGGVGHGITLGSLIWTYTPPTIGSTPISRSEGAGRGQLVSRADGTRVVRGLIRSSFRERGQRFVASEEGALRHVVIAENRIEQMFTNGISVLSVLGLPGDDLIDLENCRIERNTIVNNLLRPAENVPNRGDVLPFDPARQGEGSLIPVLPFGGIVLGTVTGGIEIRGNVIASNGTSGELPINGIFILNGDGITIAENRITGNGGRASARVAPRPGVRAGIAVMLAGTGSGVDTEAELEAFVGSEILSSNDGSSLRVFNNSVLHPEGRALHAVATGPVSIDGNSFASLGHHGSNSVSDLFAVGEAVFVMNMGPPWEDESPIFNSVYSPMPATEKYLQNSPDEDSPGERRRLMVGDGGNVVFNNNQVTYDWVLRRIPPTRLRAPISYFPVALLSLDHLSLEGNQFAFRLRGLTERSVFRVPVSGYKAPVFSHVFAVGATLQVGGNRFAESVTKTILSLLALAELMQVSTHNQSTHSVFSATTSALASPTDGPEIQDVPSDVLSTGGPQGVPFTQVGDQIMFALADINDSPEATRLRRLSLRFLELLLDRR